LTLWYKPSYIIVVIERINIKKGENMSSIKEGHIYGVHCGDKDCYACETQRYNCKELEKLDDLDDKASGEEGLRLTSISIRGNKWK